MTTRISILIGLFALLLAACSSNTQRPTAKVELDPGVDQEEWARERIGDVRVYYFIKEYLAKSSMHEGQMVKQKEFTRVLINKGHSFYFGVPDYKLRDEEFFIEDSSMYNLLVVLRDQTGIFERGFAVNIGDQDPIKRAKREARTTRVIAVEQIKDGKVNMSYFARIEGELETNKERVRRFNEAQALLREAIGNALPKGTARIGPGDTSDLDR